MKKIAFVAVFATASLALTACDTEHSESCEWERKKKHTISDTQTPKQSLDLFEGKVGGSSGGGSRGGSSGSRGGGVNMNKGSGGSSGGSGSKPKYNRSNPAPKPNTNPGKNNVWVWDCD